MKKQLLKLVEKTFAEKFKSESNIIFSPGRINLIGEHTDYNDGFAFPAAINKGIALAISKSDSSQSTVYAIDKNSSYSFDLKNVNPLEKGGWRNYILGVVGELQKSGKVLNNFNAVFSGNIPGGAGMSSSAALENAFVFGLNQLFKLEMNKHEMILISQKAEHNYAGVKCGIMDQYASMFGKKKSALLLDCRTVESQSFKIDFKKYKLMLINSNVKHDLAETAYNDRRSVCESISKQLKIAALRDATLTDLDTLKNNISVDDFSKVQYVVEENMRVKQFANAIKNEDIKSLGDLLFKSHKGLSEKYKVSCKELDFLVEQAQLNENVIGSRMMGGGFGGCTINLVKKEEIESFRKQVSTNFKKMFEKECSIYSVKLSKGTYLVK